MDSGLVAYYPFTGNPGDSSGNANHGTNNGATLTTDRFGNANQAYSFDGINDYVAMPSLNFLNTGFSFSTWFKTNSNVLQYLYGSRDGGQRMLIEIIVRGDSNKTSGEFQSNGDSYGTNRILLKVYDNLTNNEWFHVVYTIGENNGRLYLNGQLVQEVINPMSQGSIQNTSAYIGAMNDLYNSTVRDYFNGSLDDIRIYNRALSPYEISQLYGSFDKPNIITQPISQSASIQDTVSFTIEATGLNLSYQWQKNNSNITGATNDTLIIYGVQSSDAGNYRCIVSNSYGADTSDVAQLKVFSFFTDSRDNKQYKYIKIGNQYWMTENLAYIPNVSPANQSSTTSPYYYVYGYNGTSVSAAKLTNNYQNHGVLYNWPAAMSGFSASSANPSNVKGVCPTGWHLPSGEEWKQLEMSIGLPRIRVDSGGWRGSPYGGKLKETGLDYWQSPNAGANNESGFSGRGSGERGLNAFNELGKWVYYWTSTDTLNNTAAWRHELSYEYPYIGRGINTLDYGFSVRCVKDASNPNVINNPQNQVKSLGDTAIFRIYASGDSLSYQWQKNNSNISGATNDTLIIYGVQSSDAGNYRCIVSNTYGADTSNNASLSLNIVQAGTYTIDPSGNGDYTNIAAAISDMANNGISGSVIFKIKNGTYNEQLVIPAISGASATNTITFESFSGNKNDVVIQYAATSASLNYTVNFNGADYVTFRNLTIKATGTNYGTAVKFGNNADYNTLNNVNIYGKRNAYSGDRFSVVYSYQNSSFTTISNSNIYGGSIGINMIGPGWNYKEPGTAIDSNVIDSFSSLGINMQYQRECNVRGNYIHVDNSTGLSNVRGLLFTYSDSIEDVTNNQIIMEADTSYFGIMLNACENAVDLPSNFSNNMVSVKATAATTLPIGIYSLSTYYHNFYNNTVYLYGNNTSSRAFYHQSGGGIRVENSILYNNAAGFALMFLTGTGTIEHEYNALYTNGSYLLANSTSGTGFYNDLTTWQGVAFDDYYSVIYKPTLVSNTDLHIDTTDFTSVLINGVGRNAGIATDIDGDARGTSHDIGADQFDPGLIPGGTYYLGAADSNTFHSISEFQHIYNSTGATEDLIIKNCPGFIL